MKRVDDVWEIEDSVRFRSQDFMEAVSEAVFLDPGEVVVPQERVVPEGFKILLCPQKHGTDSCTSCPGVKNEACGGTFCNGEFVVVRT